MCHQESEAICLVFGKKWSAIVLTENIGAYAVPHLLDEYKEVKVWRSIEVLYEASAKSLLNVNNMNNFIKEIEVFEKETGHFIRRKEVAKYARKLFHK